MKARHFLSAVASLLAACAAPRIPADSGTSDGTGDIIPSETPTRADVFVEEDLVDTRDAEGAAGDAALDALCKPAPLTDGALPMKSLDCVRTWNDYPCATLGLSVGQQRLVAALDLRFGGELADPCDPLGASMYRVLIVGKDGMLVAVNPKSGRLRITSTDAAGRPLATVGYDRWCNNPEEPRGACCGSGPTGNLDLEIDDTALAYGFPFGDHRARMVVGLRDTPRWAAASRRLHPKPLGEQMRVAIFGPTLHAQVVGFAPPGFEEAVPNPTGPTLAAGSEDTLWMAKIHPTTKVITAFHMSDKLLPLATVAFPPPEDIMAELPGSTPQLMISDWKSCWQKGVPVFEAGPGRLYFYLTYYNPTFAAAPSVYLIARGEWSGDAGDTWKAVVRDFPMLADGKESGEAEFAPAMLIDSRVPGHGLFRRGWEHISFLDSNGGVVGGGTASPRFSPGELVGLRSAVRAAQAVRVDSVTTEVPGDGNQQATSAAVYCVGFPNGSKGMQP